MHVEIKSESSEAGPQCSITRAEGAFGEEAPQGDGVAPRGAWKKKPGKNVSGREFHPGGCVQSDCWWSSGCIWDSRTCVCAVVVVVFQGWKCGSDGIDPCLSIYFGGLSWNLKTKESKPVIRV